MLPSIVTLLIVQFLALDNVAKFVQCRKVLYEEEIFARPKRGVVEPVIEAHVVHNLDAPKSGDPYMKVLAYGKTVKLYLTPNTGFFASKYTPVFTSFVVNNEVRYQREENIVNMAVELFQSRTAAIVAHKPRHSHETHFYGSIGDMHIRPATERPRRAASEDFDYDQSDNGTWSRPVRHILYPRTNTTSTNLTEALTKDLDMPKASFVDEIVSSHRRKARDQPIEKKKIVYPSIMVVTSYDDIGARPIVKNYANTRKVNKYRNKALTERVINVLAFFLQSDLRLRHFTNPKVRLNIRGIIVATEYEATPWISKHVKKNNFVDIMEALNAINIFWPAHPVPKIDTNSYQIVATLINSKKYTPLHGLLGIAEGKICEEKKVRFAFIFDGGAFEGIIIATHEMGHLLGATHDELFDRRELPHGPIMATFIRDVDESYLRWSSRSVTEISEYLRRPDVTCADRLTYQVTSKASPLLPGKYTTAAAQCIQHTYHGVCQNNPERCVHLKCFEYVSSLPEVNRNKNIHAFQSVSAAEGTSCGIRKICLDGECVDDPEPNNVAWDPEKQIQIEPWTLETEYPICPAI